MEPLQKGDSVKVHYTGRHLDGTIFDTTAGSEPIQFTIGDEMMIPGFEAAVMKMHEGQKLQVIIKCKDAYGAYDKALVYDVNHKEIFGDRKFKIGDEVQLPTEDDVLVLKIVDLKDGRVYLDANPDLAGKDLMFDIELVEVFIGGADASDDEFASEFEDVYSDDFDDDDEFGSKTKGFGDFEDEFSEDFNEFDEFSSGSFAEDDRY